MKKEKILKWDPCWGWNSKIYTLGTKDISNNKYFFLKNTSLYLNDDVVFSSPINSRLCAGNFTNEFYFGSLSYDYFSLDNQNPIPDLDQSIFACNKDWDLISEFRPSNILSTKSKFFSQKKIGDRLIIPFRDPAPMNNNKLAVCTGGFRWGLEGNVCEVTLTDKKFKITRETILENDMRIFREIERCTFWNEFMFFSVTGNSNKIKVAKLNKSGLYSFYGEIKNSDGLFGPCVDNKLKLLYWYRHFYQINNPETSNLIFKSGEWILKDFNIRNFLRIKRRINKFFV